MAIHKHATRSDRYLGKRLGELRRSQELTPLQLGKSIRLTYQQIEKYEGGALVPIDVLQILAERLGVPIQKNLIRKIMKHRRQGGELVQDAMIELYTEALEEVTLQEIEYD
jgi:transcriptional regulator with XRE-family HTH domain